MPRTVSVLFAFLLLLLGAVLPAGAAASLVADLNPGEDRFARPTVSGFLATIGPRVLFAGEAPGLGHGLWVSDGTPLGTEVLWDFCPGDCSSGLQVLGTLRGRIAVLKVNGQGLWRTDGTRQGTSPLGPDPEEPFDTCSDQEAGVALGNVLYFRMRDSGVCAFWKTDGTREGTRPVEERADSLVRAGEKLFFPVDGGLWVSDGTPGHAALLRSWTERAPRILGAVGSRLLFVAPENGDELWVSDGTPSGTKRLTDIAAPAPFDITDFIKVFDGVAYFLVDDVTGGIDLWRSDGTAAGTRRVTAFGYSTPFNRSALSSQLVQLGDRLIFVASDGLTGSRLWSSQGTPETTAPIDCPGPCPRPESDTVFSVVGGRVLFSANNGVQGVELWGTDGTAAGTRIVRDLCPGSCSATLESFRAVPGGLFFLADDGNSRGLWKSDGTSRGTVFLVTRWSTSPFFVAQAGEKIFFPAEIGESRGQLWTSDGTPEGTVPLTAVRKGEGSHSSSFISLGSQVLFAACSDDDRKLWRTDGTPAGTAPIEKELGGSCTDIQELIPVGGLAFLRTSEAVWRTDGTPEGTFRLTPTSFWGVGEMVAFEGGVAFTTFSDTDYSLWTSDGTLAGTRTRFDWPDGFLHILASSGPSLDLLSRVPGEETRLFRSNGTLAGTQEVAALPGYLGWVIGLARLGGSLYFLEENGRLWRTDGTAAGTGPVALPPDSPRILRPLSLAEHGGRIYFLALLDRSFEEELLELWSTDGTTAGTSRVRVLGPGSDTFRPPLVSAGGRLYFPANDGEHGVELWESDGTEAGTRMAEDIAPGPASSHPGALAAIGNRLFFAAEDGIHGREPWVYSLAAACQPSDVVLCLGGGRFKVEASWRDFEGRTGRGHAVPLTADTGYFWFFDPANVEVITKVLDGRGVNNHRWVFYGALSNVEYTLTVTDTETGAARRYVNPPGRLGSVGDTNAFGPLGATGSELSVGPEAEVFEPIVTAGKPAGAKAPCVPSATRLCLAGGRFAVTARWKDFDGNTGDGQAVPLAGGDTGYFWFFGEDNVEVVLKVLDGRPVNGRFWVFYGALSSVEYTLTVTDTETGAVKTYRNPAGRLGSVADTGAF